MIDSREFRSALPCMLYSKNYEILPATLDVGDYILSKDVAVERKSIPDLIQSLASGRLFNQATSLCKYFKKPILLIEFSEDQPFSLSEFWTEEISSMSISSKLVLLILHFPNLRIMWSRSPSITADLFEQLSALDSEDIDMNVVNILSTEEGMQDTPEVLQA